MENSRKYNLNVAATSFDHLQKDLYKLFHWTNDRIIKNCTWGIMRDFCTFIAEFFLEDSFLNKLLWTWKPKF